MLTDLGGLDSAQPSCCFSGSFALTPQDISLLFPPPASQLMILHVLNWEAIWPDCHFPPPNPKLPASYITPAFLLSAWDCDASTYTPCLSEDCSFSELASGIIVSHHLIIPISLQTGLSNSQGWDPPFSHVILQLLPHFSSLLPQRIVDTLSFHFPASFSVFFPPCLQRIVSDRKILIRECKVNIGQI